ncbi:hypothetical protein MCEMRE182_00034 [Candidatus Nanopelagicaceae bacterium]
MEAERPSRFYVAKVYSRRIIRWRCNSFPYISGDAFADLADFVYKPPKFRSFKRQRIQIEDAATIFCRSEDLSEMLSLHGKSITASVIICGNSDYEFHKLPENMPSSVTSLFLQNSFISDGAFINSIPIGLENLRWGVNGNPRLLWRMSRKADNRVLFGPFGKTHHIRLEVANMFSKSGQVWDFLESRRISPIKYAWIARQYRFIAAVRGNGVDTHRHWESLYRGITPIVYSDSWSTSMTSQGIPFQLVTSWDPSEINLIVQKESLKIKPKDLPVLWMPYWAEKIRAAVELSKS